MTKFCFLDTKKATNSNKISNLVNSFQLKQFMNDFMCPKAPMLYKNWHNDRTQKPKIIRKKSRTQKRPLFRKQILKKDNYKVFDEQYKKSITKRNEKSLVYRLIFLKSVWETPSNHFKFLVLFCKWSQKVRCGLTVNFFLSS